MSARPTIVIYVPRKQGGVRHVTQSLATAVSRHGFEVIVAETARQFFRAALEDRSRYGIGSLAAGFACPLFRRSVYILHGFATHDTHSLARRVVLRVMSRMLGAFGTKLCAVSDLTRMVHERLFGIRVDERIHNGVGEQLLARSSSTPKEKLILYVGRLIAGKGVERIVDGFRLSGLAACNYRLALAGDGPLKEVLRDLIGGDPAIDLLGEISEERKITLLNEADIFISLNNFEPMGVVFAEAVVTECKIVAPHCGGHREFIPQHYPMFACDPASAQDVAQALGRAARSDERFRSEQVRDYFSYEKRVAPAYLALLGIPSTMESDRASSHDQ